MTDKPLFHRGHYNILAAQFRRYLEEITEPRETDSRDTVTAIIVARATTLGLASEVADRLAQDNPLFDREMFLKACTPQE